MNEQTATVSPGDEGERTLSRLTARPAALVLAVGFALYVFVQVGLVFGPIVARPVPPGTTDAYVYIAKAEQLRACLRQRCPALADLRMQVGRGSNLPDNIARQRGLAHQRGLLQYHLAHSALLYVLRSAGIGYELALNILSVAGAVMIACAVAWLLTAAFGVGPAGLALALLAFAVYPGYHGLHWIVPSTMALGLGLLSWAAVLARVRGLTLILPFLILAAAWTHPIGSVYGAGALALYAGLISWRSPRGWAVLVLGVVAAASPLIAAQIIERPTLSFQGLHAKDGWDLVAGVEKNLRAAWWAVQPWLNERGGAAVLALAALGLMIAGAERRRGIWALATLAAGLAAASLVYVLPRYPGEMFHRMFVPFAIVATGIAAFAVWRSVELFVAPRDRVGRGGFAAAMRSAAGLSVRIVAAALVAMAAVLSALGSLANGSRATLAMARYMTAWGIMPLDRGQPSRVLAMLGKNARITYFDDLSFYFYASNGGLAHGAVFDPAVSGTALAARYYGADGRMALSVRARDGFYGYVALRARQPVVIRSVRQIDWSRLRLNLSIRGPAVALDLRLLDGAGTRPVTVRFTKDKTGWRALGFAAGTKGRVLVITRRDGGPLAWIQGVRTAPDARNAWPWDAGVTILQWKLPASEKSVIAQLRQDSGWSSRSKTVALHRFETATLTPPGCHHGGIVADFGATVASRIACGVVPAQRPVRRPAKSRRRRKR
ncbi:MAG TPA: hypothetical protein VM325_07185 [Alphaproteobacteria bacterium]|nr:hypothetical protein [Alphaproteobacteria bacterium]